MVGTKGWNTAVCSEIPVKIKIKRENILKVEKHRSAAEHQYFQFSLEGSHMKMQCEVYTSESTVEEEMSFYSVPSRDSIWNQNLSTAFNYNAHPTNNPRFQVLLYIILKQTSSGNQFFYIHMWLNWNEV